MSGAGASFVSPAVAATGGGHATASQLGDARSGKLADNLTGFGRALRRAGVPVDAARMALAQQVALFVSRLRSQPFADAFQRAPGIAESVEWAKALVALDTLVVDPEVVSDTAGILFKQREDVAALTAALASELLQPEPEAS